jgi:hypothetical protein
LPLVLLPSLATIEVPVPVLEVYQPLNVDPFVQVVFPELIRELKFWL